MFENVNDTVKATSITAFVTVVTFFIGKFWEQSRERKSRISAEKIVVYRKFFDFYFDINSYEKIHGKPKPEAETLRELLEFQKDIVFWAPDPVLKAFLNFKEVLAEFSGRIVSASKEDLPEHLAIPFKSVAVLLAAMRRDIGYTFTTFDAIDLAKLQLSTDPETKKIFNYLSHK